MGAISVQSSQGKKKTEPPTGGNIFEDIVGAIQEKVSEEVRKNSVTSTNNVKVAGPVSVQTAFDATVESSGGGNKKTIIIIAVSAVLVLVFAVVLWKRK